MKKNWLIRSLSALMLAALILALTAPVAGAKVIAFVTADDAGTYYEYAYDELLLAYTKTKLGTASPLFHDYQQKTMAMFLDDHNGYVGYEAALAAYAKAVFSGKSFDLDAFTASSAAEPMEPAAVKLVTYAEGRLVYTDKVLADPLVVALQAINAAADAEAIRWLIESKAPVLGLDLSLYRGLSESAKDAVAEGIYLQRGSGFTTVDAFIAAFSYEVQRLYFAVEGLLAAINGAANLEEFMGLILGNGEKLGLELAAFQMIIASRSQQVLAQVFWSGPYASADALRDSFNSAVAACLKSYVIVSNTFYTYSVADMLDIQMPLKPKWYVGGWTNAPRNEVQRYVDPERFLLPSLAASVRELIVLPGTLFVRQQPTTAAASIASVGKGEIYTVAAVELSLEGTAEGSEGYWFLIDVAGTSGWVCGRHADWVLEDYSPDMFQFLVLSGKSGVTVADLGLILQGKGILAGTEQVFFQASHSNNINEIFLTSLALHESGNGTSQLANGVLYTPSDPALPAQVVYNMYGIGAVDSNPILKGAEFAYNEGWFSPEEAIIGGAYFVARNYVNNSNYYQDTLYKMRWNPGAPGKHQYATDIGWASKQTKFIQQFYAKVNMYCLRFDLPAFLGWFQMTDYQ